MQRFTSKESVLQENVDTQVQSLSSFQTNSSKGNTLNNQNNFSDKSNILKINSDLATPATSALRKSVSFRSYAGPHFPAFGLNTERYAVSILT